MRIWKGIIFLFIGLVALLLSTITASSLTVTDDIDDVYSSVSETFGSKPNVDITTMTYELSGDSVTLTMTVKGNIVDSGYITYTIWTNSTLLSGYTAQYNNGTGFVLKDMGDMVDSDFLVSQGNTIIVTFTLSDSTEVETLVGYAMESSEGYVDAWADYAPSSFSPWYSEDDDDEPIDDDDEPIDDGDDTAGDGDGDKGGGTPGFEAVAVIVALAIIFIILRRKK